MVGWTDAKAIENNFFVSQDRDPEDRNRLETDVVPDVNGAFQRIFIKGRLSLLQDKLLFESLCCSPARRWGREVFRGARGEGGSQILSLFLVSLSPSSDAGSEMDVKSKFCQVFSPEMEKRLCTLYAKRLLVFFKGCLKKVLGGVRAQAWNLKELTERHYKKWSLRLNLTQRGKIYQAKTSERIVRWNLVLTWFWRNRVVHGHFQFV